MFNCNACLRRAVSSLAADLPPSTTSSLLIPRTLPGSLFQPNHPSLTPHRTSTTFRSISKGHHRRILTNALQQDEIPKTKRRNPGLPTKVERRDRLARENNAAHLATPDEKRRLQRQAATEARFLVDPLRLANDVKHNLQKDDFDKAMELVRASEKQGLIDGKRRGEVNNVVSWNHLCDYSMARGDPKTALKTYNEMKKRGHNPDAHTYTIMLRGFGANIRKPNAVADAMKVYNSMFDPSNDVKPNAIHHNAIISVCARGGDMDAVWSVAARLPEKGAGQSDHVTYTIILKALTWEAINKAAKVMAQEGRKGDEENESADKVFENAIEDGRKLWRDVIVKWRRANLKIDETLACSMGRLLLLGKRRKDILDVFRLVEQTMGVRVPKIDSDPDTAAEDVEEQETEEQALTVFTPLVQSELSEGVSDASAMYVQPGRNTLSMLMEASLLAKAPHIGRAYWSIFTSSKNNRFYIAPDANNVTAYLRLLRFSRASSAIVDVIRENWPEEVTKELHRRGTYVIAMSACVRDKFNPNIFDIASRVVDTMQQHTLQARAGPAGSAEEQASDDANEDQDFDESGMPPEAGLLDIDPKVLAMYLNLAMFTTPGVNPKLYLKKSEKSTKDNPFGPEVNNTLRALRRMGPDTVNVKRLLTLKLAELDMRRNVEQANKGRREISPADKRMLQNTQRSLESLEDLVGLVRAMVSAYDRMLALDIRLIERKEKGFGKEVIMDMKLQKAKMSALLGKVGRFMNPDGPTRREGSIRVKSEEGAKDESLKKTGVWEGYAALEPTKPPRRNSEMRNPFFPRTSSKPDRNDLANRDRDEDNKNAKDDSVESDTFLMRTTVHANLKRAVKRESFALKKAFPEQKTKRLSRRQKQEEEKDRREKRVRALREYDVKSRLGRTGVVGGSGGGGGGGMKRGFGVGEGRKDRERARDGGYTAGGAGGARAVRESGARRSNTWKGKSEWTGRNDAAEGLDDHMPKIGRSRREADT